MKLAKIIKIGNSQAVKLTKEFHFHCKEVQIFKNGNEIVLREEPQNLARAFELLVSLPEDFLSSWSG